MRFLKLMWLFLRLHFPMKCECGLWINSKKRTEYIKDLGRAYKEDVYFGEDYHCEICKPGDDDWN